MARTAETIFQEMVAQKEATPELSALTSKSATAIWRLILYVAAYAIAVHERLWDAFKEEVEQEVAVMKPHGRQWYREKVLAFMADMTLMPDTDQYDTSGMSQDQIEAARVVKYAAVNERAATSKIDIKVAGENASGQRCPITAAEETQLKAYIAEIKDAGVQTVVWNQTADQFACSITIYYNAMREPQTVEAECLDVIRSYVENLPFNGVLTKRALAERLQTVDGVELVGEIAATAQASTQSSAKTIGDYDQPEAGYYALTQATLTMTAYRA